MDLNRLKVSVVSLLFQIITSSHLALLRTSESRCLASEYVYTFIISYFKIVIPISCATFCIPTSRVSNGLRRFSAHSKISSFMLCSYSIEDFISGDQLYLALLDLRHAVFRFFCPKAINFFIERKVEARQKLLNQTQPDICRKG